MNLFSCFTSVDPTENGFAGKEYTYRPDVGEWQFFWRGFQTDSAVVKKILEGYGYPITYVERLPKE